MKGFRTVNLIYHERCQFEQGDSVPAYDQMDELFIRWSDPDGSSAERPLGIRAKTRIDLIQAGQLRAGLCGCDDVRRILPIASGHNGSDVAIGYLEYRAIPREISFSCGEV